VQLTITAAVVIVKGSIMTISHKNYSITMVNTSVVTIEVFRSCRAGIAHHCYHLVAAYYFDYLLKIKFD